jgi:hypothetical protein
MVDKQSTRTYVAHEQAQPVAPAVEIQPSTSCNPEHDSSDKSSDLDDEIPTDDQGFGQPWENKNERESSLPSLVPGLCQSKNSSLDNAEKASARVCVFG